MDKNTLSNYGWIVIAVLVLAVMIALATPFGQYIEQGVRSTTEGLFSTSQNAMNTAFGDLGVEVKDQTFEEGYSNTNSIQTPKELTTLTTMNWNVSGLIAEKIWTDKTNIYYSSSTTQYVLNGDTWETKTWTGLTSFHGDNIWTDGEDIYYGNEYILNGNNWEKITFTPKLSPFNPENVWTDGLNIYYSNSSSQYVFDKTTKTFSSMNWKNLTWFDGEDVWTDGTNYYYSEGSKQYVLNKATYTWEPKTWNGLTSFYAYDTIWTDGVKTYYSSGTKQYVLNGDTWETKVWNGATNFSGENIWTDGTKYYHSSQYGTPYIFS